jgi:hypothetical protein
MTVIAAVVLALGVASCAGTPTSGQTCVDVVVLKGSAPWWGPLVILVVCGAAALVTTLLVRPRHRR